VPPTTAGRVCASTLRPIGNTTVVRLGKLVGPDSARVLVKLESCSPTGSYKDRMALAMIGATEARGDLRPGMTVIGVSGDSTGSTLALVCAVKRYHIASADAFAPEELRMIGAFGAELTIVASQSGIVRPKLIVRTIKEVHRVARADDVYWTDQLNNADALTGYEAVGRELLAQADECSDAFCAAVVFAISPPTQPDDVSQRTPR
jgi:cysteine synthase